jgi:hypothetical protein
MRLSSYEGDFLLIGLSANRVLPEVHFDSIVQIGCQECFEALKSMFEKDE